jgi:hypothetical protein
LAENLRDLGLTDQAGLDQQGADAPAIALLQRKGVVELLSGDDLSLDEELAEPDSSRNHIPQW